MLDHHMLNTSKRKSTLEKEIASASRNRVITGKIDVESLVQKAAVKLENLNFEQKKHIIERVITKIIKSKGDNNMGPNTHTSVSSSRKGRV
jgi:hypothetical protein